MTIPVVTPIALCLIVKLVQRYDKLGGKGQDIRTLKTCVVSWFDTKLWWIL